MNPDYAGQGIKAFYESNAGALNQARTMAFTTLAFAELFHMIGMTDVKHSFIHIFKDKNIMLWIAILAGVVLQLMVVELPGLSNLFKTSSLDLAMWGIVAALSVLPLVVHEIYVIVLKIQKARKKD